MIVSYSGQVAFARGQLGQLGDCETKCAQACANARPFITCIEPCLKSCGVSAADLPGKIAEVINAGVPVPVPTPGSAPAPSGGGTSSSSSSSSGVSPIVWVLGGLLAIGAAVLFAGGGGRMRANP